MDDFKRMRTNFPFFFWSVIFKNSTQFNVANRNYFCILSVHAISYRLARNYIPCLGWVTRNYIPLLAQGGQKLYSVKRHIPVYSTYGSIPSPRMHRRYLHNLCGKHLHSTEAPRDYSPKNIIHYLLSEQQMKEIFVFRMTQILHVNNFFLLCLFLFSRCISFDFRPAI